VMYETQQTRFMLRAHGTLQGKGLCGGYQLKAKYDFSCVVRI
jgi:hypothetical protein